MEQISERFEELIDLKKDDPGKNTDTSKYNQNLRRRQADNKSRHGEKSIGSIQSSQANKSQI